MPALQPIASSFRHLRHRFTDPDAFAVAVSGASLVADFLAPQARPTEVEQFQWTGWTLDFHEAHVKARVRATLPPGWASVGLMRSVAASSWYGRDAGKGVLVCTPPGESIDGRITPGFTCLAVGMPVALWERCRALAGIERNSFGSAAVLHLPAPLFGQFERQLRTSRQRLRTASAAPQLSNPAITGATEFAMSLMITAWELSTTAAPPRESPRNRARLARRAEAWMRDHLAEAVQVPDVCLALRVSRRELEYAFRAAFDQSPRAHLQALRLNAIRRILLRSRDEGAVFRAAFDHGITHLGRFAAEYRALFGENPSETRHPRLAASRRPLRSDAAWRKAGFPALRLAE